MKYDYNQLFAKEYSGYTRIRQGVEEAFRVLEGCRLTDWRTDASLGIHALEFGTKSLSSGTRIPITVKSESVRSPRPANPPGFRLSMD